MKRPFLLSMVTLLGLATIASAKSQKRSCATTAKQIIRKGYSEGGMKLHRLTGPFRWNEPFFDDKGNPGIKHRLAFVVSYAWEKEFRKGKRPGTVLLVGECVEGEPDKLLDRNKDKALTMDDFITVRR